MGVLDGGELNSNYVNFTLKVGGAIYSGDVTLSGGQITDSKPPGSNYNRLGDKISAGTVIRLNSEDRSHTIEFTVDEDGIDLSGSTKAGVIKKLNKASVEMEAGLNGITVQQSRVVANINEKLAIGTMLAGVKKDNVHIIGNQFQEDGAFGNISKFSVNVEENKLSVDIGGIEYSQIFSDKESLGGLAGRYDSAHKILLGAMKLLLP